MENKKRSYSIALSLALIASYAFGKEVVEEDIKLGGLYLGAGACVNEDSLGIRLGKGERLTVNDSCVLREGDSVQKVADSSYGAHAFVGYSYIFKNGALLAIEGQVEGGRHPDGLYTAGSDEICRHNAIVGAGFLALIRAGYRFNSFPGVAFVSAGIHTLKISQEKDSLTISRPVIGIGYQHGLSNHWSARGDILYSYGS